MSTATIFGERSFTVVAGTFRNPVNAATAARSLQDSLPTAKVRLVQPEDPALPVKLEPDQDGIFRTLIRSHIVLAVSGAVVGVLAAAAMLAAGWPAAVSSPGFIVLTTAVGGAVIGMLVAGLLTLRPDRSYVIRQVRNRTRHGEWAVVAHPADEAEADSVRNMLRNAGGEVVRSL